MDEILDAARSIGLLKFMLDEILGAVRSVGLLKFMLDLFCTIHIQERVILLDTSLAMAGIRVFLSILEYLLLLFDDSCPLPLSVQSSQFSEIDWLFTEI